MQQLALTRQTLWRIVGNRLGKARQVSKPLDEVSLEVPTFRTAHRDQAAQRFRQGRLDHQPGLLGIDLTAAERHDPGLTQVIRRLRPQRMPDRFSQLLKGIVKGLGQHRVDPCLGCRRLTRLDADRDLDPAA